MGRGLGRAPFRDQGTERRQRAASSWALLQTGDLIDLALDVGGLAKPPPNPDDDPKNENHGQRRGVAEAVHAGERAAGEAREEKQRGKQQRSVPQPSVAE